MLLQNKRIFLVEDEIANRAIAQMMLEGQGAKTAIERWGNDLDFSCNIRVAELQF